MHDSRDGGGRAASATHTTPGMEEVACVRNKQSRDVGRYDSMDGGGRATTGSVAEGNG